MITLGVDLRSGEALPAPELDALGAALRKDGAPAATQKLGLPTGMNELRLDKTGWGVVWADDVSASVKQALKPLLDRRKAEAAASFLELSWKSDDTTARAWLRRHQVGGFVEPRKVPYYLMLVGSPSSIPFERQCELAAAGYAVGRLQFEADADYASYARGVLAASDSAPSKRSIGFWAPRHDAATIASHDSFARHLALGEDNAVEDWQKPTSALHGFTSRLRLNGDAKKTELLGLLKQAPPVWVTASHGIGVAAGDGDARAQQGALLTQDWPGVGQLTPDQLVAAADLGGCNLLGSIGLVMACFGAGTPAADPFPWTSAADRAKASAYYSGKPFVAALPQRLLSLDSGSALGLVAHVDRAWSMSFAPFAAGDRNGAFRTLLAELMRGQRLGHAARELWARHAQLSTFLATALAPDATPIADAELGELWLEQRDARNYLLLGDPAVQLKLDSIAATN